MTASGTLSPVLCGEKKFYPVPGGTKRYQPGRSGTTGNFCRPRAPSHTPRARAISHFATHHIFRLSFPPLSTTAYRSRLTAYCPCPATQTLTQNLRLSNFGQSSQLAVPITQRKGDEVGQTMHDIAGTSEWNPIEFRKDFRQCTGTHVISAEDIRRQTKIRDWREHSPVDYVNGIATNVLIGSKMVLTSHIGIVIWASVSL